MSDLPPGWECVNFGEILHVQYGVGLPDRVRNRYGSVPVYGSAGVSGRHSSALLDAPVIVIGRKGNVGAVHLTDGPSWPIDTTYFVRVPDGVSERFLLYQLLSMQLNKLDSSTAVPSLRRSDLEAQLLAVAPTPEQARIVAAIEEQFSRLDAGVAALERVRQNLKRMRAAVLQAAVTGRLTADWRLNHRSADSTTETLDGVLKERRKAWEQAELHQFQEANRVPPVGWDKRYKEATPHEETLLPSSVQYVL